ncbi:MAG: Rieske 2Fe-2S domain-containing protein [Nitrospirales bacterium]
MLSTEENDLITRVGPGTPMGELARRFWVPILLAEELSSPDCPPVRVDILGEQLIAFKDSAGKIGLMERWCPHRLSDLFYGRNEDNGLRCVYHGWKFDVEGTCLDVPNAPEGATYKDKIHARAYKAQERGGLIWAYLGPQDKVPAFSEMEWTRVPDSHRYVSKMFLDCNYLQTLEADIDSSHISFLHSLVQSEYGVGIVSGDINGQPRPFAARDKTPVWTVKDTEYGVMLCARRDAGENYYWRVNQWMMPFYTMIAGQPDASLLCQVKIPVDDERSVAFRVRWHPDRPLTPEELYEYKERGVLFPKIIPGTYQTEESYSNDYLIDRAQQRNYSFTGIKSIPAQDFAVTEVQGGSRRTDRAREHLVSSDTAIIQVRKRLIKSCRELQEGIEPPEAHDGEAYRVRSLDIVLPKDTLLEEGGKPYLVSKV